MLEALLSLPLIAARTVHFASTVMITGIFIFLFLIEPPALWKDREDTRATLASFHRRLLSIAWWSLVFSVISGAAWLVLLAAKITRSSPAQALSDGTVRIVLTRTQFGHDWQARFVLAALLAGGLVWLRQKVRWRRVEVSILAALAATLLGTLAWSGHGGATPGLRGEVHATADVLHLIAAGMWIGGLLPLRALLSITEKSVGAMELSIARDATLRFSTLGIVAVATLIVTGFFNAWVLVGSVPALFEDQYGQLLLLKLIIFLVLLGVAGFNRIRLTPTIADASESESPARLYALRRLKRNCVVETSLGLAILFIVGALGTISPGMHVHTQ